MAKEPDKLAQDVSKALAAGMSYGKWKAMQDRPVKVKKGIPVGWKVCQYCGDPYKPSSGRRQFYCGADCQRKAQLERYRYRNTKYMREYRAKLNEGSNEDGQSKNVGNEQAGAGEAEGQAV